MNQNTFARAHPTLVQCFCGIKVTTDYAATDSDVFSENTVKVKNCLGDEFGETGIRWYLNGPFDSTIAYQRGDIKTYQKDRAALKLMRLGYECQSIQLIDPNEIPE